MKIINHNIQLLLSFFFSVLLFSCESLNDINIVDGISNITANLEETTIKQSLLEPRSIVYFESADIWMIHQSDPYSLSNFQNAYDIIADGKSSQYITKAQQAEFPKGKQLQATHYCLKVFPRNEGEEWSIESIPDVKVSSIPFDYIQLPASSFDVLSLNDKSSVTLFSDKNPHTVICDHRTTKDSFTRKDTIVMPILYVVWPCSKTLPVDYDYIIDYKAYIPDYNQKENAYNELSDDCLLLLENEAVHLSLGTTVSSINNSKNVVTYQGDIYHYDNLLSANVPVSKLKLRIQLGSNMWDGTSLLNGHFYITGTNIPSNATFSIIFEDSKWKVTPENSTAPITISYGYLSSVFDSANHTVINANNYPLPCFEINIAAAYLYYGNHQFPIYQYNNGIRIKALSGTNATMNGYFSCSFFADEYIVIYNNNRNHNGKLTGTILHELGHSIMYGFKNGFINFNATHNLIKESWASFTGWKVGELYYQNMGCPPSLSDITGQARQSWIKESTLVYSPLFVDLMDNQNQHLNNILYNDDPISGVPLSVLTILMEDCKNWTQFKNVLQEYIGTYYANTQYNTFIAPYNYWFANN